MKISAVAARLTLRIEDLCHHLFPGGKRVANEFRIGDITGGPGDSLAINLTHPKCGLWVDRANPSSHGDALQLIQISQNLPDAIAAADWARRWLGIPAWTPGEDANAPKEWDPLKEARFSVDDEWKLPVAAWAYRDAQGALIAWVCRYIKANGSKDVIPWRRTTVPVKNRAGKEIPVGTWRAAGWKGDEKRPIYGLDRLAKNPTAPVAVFEGEKTADAGAKLYPNVVCIAWQGGARSRRSRAPGTPWSRAGRFACPSTRSRCSTRWRWTSTRASTPTPAPSPSGSAGSQATPHLRVAFLGRSPAIETTIV